MAKTVLCSINLGAAGQLNGKTLPEAFLGVQYLVTTSSSTWGHEASPTRFYMTGFVFVDTDKVPLIEKNEGTVVNLVRTELPDADDFFFNDKLVPDEFVVGVWEAKGDRANTELIRLFYRIFKDQFKVMLEQSKVAHADRVASMIGSELGDQSEWRKMEQSHIIEGDNKQAGLAHMAARGCGQRISELERVYDLGKRIDTASLVIVQIKNTEYKAALEAEAAKKGEQK